MLQIKEISKTFNPGTVNEKKALRSLSLTLADGDFVTVIGGNGAGKSTLLNAIAGTWFVDEGKITIDDIDVTKLPEHKRAKYLGRVFQDPMTSLNPTMRVGAQIEEVFLGRTDVSKKDAFRKLVRHPCIIAVFVGLILMVAPISLPNFLEEAIDITSGCTVPLSMIVIGTILADAPIRSLFSKSVLWYTCLRLVFFPVLIWLVLKPFPLDSTLVNVCILITGMPAGSTTSILADKYGGDAIFASQIIFASTLCSILTIPLLTFLMGV